jgi:hypothetical protein
VLATACCAAPFLASRAQAQRTASISVSCFVAPSTRLEPALVAPDAPAVPDSAVQRFPIAGLGMLALRGGPGAAIRVAVPTGVPWPRGEAGQPAGEPDHDARASRAIRVTVDYMDD